MLAFEFVRDDVMIYVLTWPLRLLPTLLVDR